MFLKSKTKLQNHKKFNNLVDVIKYNDKYLQDLKQERNFYTNLCNKIQNNGEVMDKLGQEQEQKMVEDLLIHKLSLVMIHQEIRTRKLKELDAKKKVEEGTQTDFHKTVPGIDVGSAVQDQNKRKGWYTSEKRRCLVILIKYRFQTVRNLSKCL